MARIVFENNSNGTLLADINNSQTTITLASGQGANFPALGVNEIFFITLQNYAAQLIEICRVTARTGDALTVVRGVDGTTPLAWTVADTAIQLRLTKETLESFVQTGEILTDITYEFFTSTEGQSIFNTAMDLPTTETGIVVDINGVRQYPPANFTRTGLNQVTMDEGLALGDEVVIGA